MVGPSVGVQTAVALQVAQDTVADGVGHVIGGGVVEADGLRVTEIELGLWRTTCGSEHDTVGGVSDVVEDTVDDVGLDGFEFYEKVVRNVLGVVVAIHGQVSKTRRNNRVVRVERTLKIGTKSLLAEALLESEDSESLNTSFVERMNLTLRQSLAYLQRRSPAHARCDRRLDEDLDLVQCHYNFVRPHLALKFGNVCKTPAMQAGLTKRPLSFRDIFGRSASSRPLAAVVLFPVRRVVAGSAAAEAALAA